MKILKFLSLFLLMLIVGVLITANIFHQTLRNKIDPHFQSLTYAKSSNDYFQKESNHHYLFQLTTDQDSYPPYQGILVYARLINTDNKTIPENTKIEVSFSKDQKPALDIQNKNKIRLHYQKDNQVWVGQWFPIDHRVNGTIKIKGKAFLTTPEKPLTTKNDFFIESERQNQLPIQKGLALISIDSKERISRRTIISTEGEEVSWNEIPNWIQFIDADGVLMLGGITKTFEENASIDNPWEKDKINESITLSEKLKKEGKSFGVWIKALELEGTYLEKMGYQPTLKLSKSSITKSKNFISLQDPNRKKHLSKLITHFLDHNAISYVGLSKLFPKNHSGIEMLEHFIQETQIPFPNNWTNWTQKEKTLAFEQDLEKPAFFKAFSRWKYYKIASYVRQILPKKHEKPIFYSTDYAELMEHPDLIPLLLESGVDFIVLNLNPSFDHLFSEMGDLKKYADIDRYYSKILISYELDYKKIHQEHYQISAIQNFTIINDDLSKFSTFYPNIQGLVIRDFYRAMFGKRGPYSPYEWMLGISKTIHHYKSATRIYPIHVTASVPLSNKNGDPMNIKFRVINQGDKDLYHLKIQLLPMMGKTKLQDTIQDFGEISAGTEIEIPLHFSINLPESKFVRKRQFLGYHFSWSDVKSKKPVHKYGFTDYKSFILQTKTQMATNTNINESSKNNAN